MTVEINEEIGQLLDALTGADASRRAQAARQLGQLEETNLDVVTALERSVATDTDQQVQQTALAALDSPASRQLRRQRMPVQEFDRRRILAEIEHWDAEGLIQAPLTQLLAGRYAVPTARPAKKAQRRTRVENRSLGEILLSETSIKIALFLGAFFILAASIILAALVEVARLPILVTTTIGFLIAAGVLYRRIRLSSFIMFIIGALLFGVDGRILLDQLGISGQDTLIWWSTIAFLLSAIFAVGVWLYDSRLLTLLSYGSLVAAVVLLAVWLEVDPHVIYLLVAISAAAGLLVARFLERVRGQHLFWPLFWAANLLLGVTMAASFLTLGYQAIDDSPPSGILWLPVAALWLLACLIFFASDRMIAGADRAEHKSLQALVAICSVGALTPVPLLLAGAFGPTDRQLMIVAWLWGLVLAVSAQAADERIEALPGIYSPLMFIASALLFLLASLQQWLVESALAVGFLAATAVVYLLLTIRQMRWSLWSGTLLAAYLAYLAAFSLTRLASLDIFAGYVQLLPITVSFAIAVGLKSRATADTGQWAPPLAFSGALASFTLLYAPLAGEPTQTAFILLVYAVLFAILAVSTGNPLAVFGATGSLAAALHFILYEVDSAFVAWPYVALAAIYYLLGLALSRQPWRAIPDLGELLRWSGLGLSLLASILVLLESDAVSALSVTAAALLFTFEARSERNLWFGYPAICLYFAAYAIVLKELDVSEPQFYSVVAALLGLIMHYLMLRAGNRFPALITGLVSQLILLSTTYVQMAATDEFRFFVILFTQALILLGYGVVIRCRSFVVTPTFFVVLGVTTVTLSVLSGLPVALIVGCAGFVLLLLGTMGLWFRQRLSTSAGSVSRQMVGWNW